MVAPATLARLCSTTIAFSEVSELEYCSQRKNSEITRRSTVHRLEPQSLLA